MKSYHKILRRLISHPKTAILYCRQLTQRHRKACVHCGVLRKLEIHHTDQQGVITYRCKECRKTFSELYGTIFYRSKVPLWIWLSAVIEYTISTGSISAAEIARRYGVTHKTAWILMTKIRKEIFIKTDLVQLENEVESDEAWFGRKDNQHIILGMVQREKRNLIFEIIDNVQEKTLYPLIEKHVVRGSRFFTDSRITYSTACVYYKHQTTNHSKGEFSRGNGIHSNTIEQIWGDIKGIIRTIHHGISKKYRKYYLAQYAFKYQNIHNSNFFYLTLSKLFSPMYCII